MDILVVCRNSDDYRLLFNGSLQLVNNVMILRSTETFNMIDFDFGLRRLRQRVKAVELVFTGIT